MPRDPKSRWTKDRHRLITIHDGTRLTPAVVGMLAVLVEEAQRLADDERHSYQSARAARDELAPRLVARADGLAIYVPDRRLG